MWDDPDGKCFCRYLLFEAQKIPLVVKCHLFVHTLHGGNIQHVCYLLVIAAWFVVCLLVPEAITPSLFCHKLTCLLDWCVIGCSYKNTVIFSSSSLTAASPYQHTRSNAKLTLLHPLIPTSSFIISRSNRFLWRVFGKQWSQQLTVTQTY